MKRIITLLTLLLAFVTTAQKVEYDKNSKWYFGLNSGATWHTSDVDTKLRLGGGFVFGKSFNMDYGRLLSFDLGFRYLYGYWEGVDKNTTTVFSANTPVNEFYSEPDLYRQNFLSEQHRFALELALHANRLRERTGWDPYIFGGIGLTAHQAYGDIFTYDDDFNVSTYDFANGEDIDRVYRSPLESAAENETYDDFRFGVMPSLGIGIGYYFGPRISFGIEHKTTFTLTDYYDGTVVNSNGLADNYNDLYHYTNLYLKWYIKSRKYEEEFVEEPQPEENDFVEDVNKSYLPVVTFRNPATTPTQVNAPNYTIKASVKYVAGRENVSFTQNGNARSNFSYNASTDAFEANVSFIPGQNSFTILGSNEEGAAQETVIINYIREEKTPPIVDITRPSNTPQTVYQNTYSLTASVLNVSGKQDIRFLFNNQETSSFNYNAQNGVLTASLILNTGTNTVQIIAENQDGSDNDIVNIVYREANPVKHPEVEFTNPSYSPYTHNMATFTLNAQVAHVNGANDITFKINGVENQNFSFNNNTGLFTANVNLSGGQNVFEIIASNNAGSDEDITFINYRKPAAAPPVVSITNPQNPTYLTNNNSHTLVANVLNITSANQINFSVNGQNSTNFNFNGNTLTANIPLIEGNNLITITATNDDGTDSKQTTIVYKRPQQVQKPNVVFTTPNVSPFTVNQANFTINAAVYNVTQSSQISVSINGNNISNFSFNNSNHQVSFTTSLIEGADLVYITATNSAGSDNATQTIIYRKPANQRPPLVSFVNPATNGSTVYNNNYGVEAKVENVSSAQNISVKINGISTSNFIYTASSQRINFNAGLSQGANAIEVKGTNAYGQDTKTTTIIYKRQLTTKAPVVNITNPNNTVTVGTTSYNVSATVENISTASNINVIVNGSGVQNFTFNANTQQLNFPVSFNNAGSYNIQIVATNSAGSASDNARIIYKPKEEQKLPEVYYLNPNSAGTIVNLADYTLKAKVLHVSNKNQISLSVNGQLVASNAYSYNTASKEIRYVHNLNVGNNVYTINANNGAGSVQENTSIVYRPVKEPCKNPVITIPAAQKNNTSNIYVLNAEVTEMGSSTNVTIRVNGMERISQFNAPRLSARVPLIPGNNQIEVIAINDCGKTVETINIMFEEEPCEKPEISTKQTLRPKTQQNAFTFNVQVQNVDTKNAIRVMLNGNETPFTYDLGTKQLSVNASNLKIGNNTLIIKAKTKCGEDAMSINITREECKKPSLQLRSSLKQGTVQQEWVTISGSISNLEGRPNIRTKLNGRTVNYNYSSFNNSFVLKTQLNIGKNKLVIETENDCGTSNQVFNFNYMPKPTVKAPTVKITSPGRNPFTTNTSNITLKASTTGINSANQIQVKVNGTSTRFRFVPNTNLIKINTNLSKGNNFIQISVANQTGNANDNITIKYEPKIVVAKPVINVKSPDANPTYLSQEGRIIYSATVSNISNANQVKVYINGKLYSNYQASLNNGVLSFNFYVSVTKTKPSHQIQVVAINPGGTANKTTSVLLNQSKNKKPLNIESGGTRKPTTIERRRR